MCQSDQTTDKKRNKLKRAGVWAPVRKRKPDAGPKWYEFKVVPLNRDKHYNSLAARPPCRYLMPDPLIPNNNLRFFRGKEAYVEFDGTSPTNVWSHSGEEKYFLFPEISPAYLFHWPNFKKSLTDEPINYEKALKNIAESRYDAFRAGCPSHAQTGDDLAFSKTILYYAARTGESVSIRHCKWCMGGTFLRSADHIKTCKGYQRHHREYQQRCKLLRESEVTGEQSLHIDSTYSRWAPRGNSYRAPFLTSLPPGCS